MPETNSVLDRNSQRPEEETHQPKKMTIKKKILWSLVGILLAAGIAEGVDLVWANNRIGRDRKTHWETLVDNDSIYTTSPEGKTVAAIGLNDLIRANSSLLEDGLNDNLLTSVMLSEDSLKTKNGWWIKKFDDKLEKLGVERSKSSSSYTWRLLSMWGHTWSYWAFQTQREMFDKYKNNPELFNKLLNDVANFKIQNVKGEYEELYKQLWYKNIEDMVEDIKNHNIEIYTWWWRTGDVFGIVWINEIFREINEPIRKINCEELYKHYSSQASKMDKENKFIMIVNKRSRNDHSFRNNVMSMYTLQDNGSKIWFKDIVDIYKSQAFQNWFASALWCIDNVEGEKNCVYLTLLQLMEINEYFEKKWKEDINIVEATWSFWKTCLKLVNKHFQKNFNNENEARHFLNEEIGEEKINSLYKQEVEEYYQHLRTLFLLWNNENNPDEWTNITPEQSSFLKHSIKLTFNTKVITFDIFKKYIDDNTQLSKEKKNDIFNKINSKRNDYVINQNKEAFEELTDIMVDFDKFREITGLDKKQYIDYLKGYLWQSLLSHMAIIWDTELIIPEIQNNPGWSKTWNEMNSIRRFAIWVEIQEAKELDIEKWFEHEIIEWENNFNTMRNVLWENDSVKNYLMENCMTYDWKTIESPDDIPWELVYEIIRNESWERIDNIVDLKVWDKIRLKTKWLENIYDSIDDLWDLTEIYNKETKIIKGKWKNKKEYKKFEKASKTICKNNDNWTYEIVGSWEYLQNILYKYAQKSPKLKRIILKMLNKEELSAPEDISAEVIKEIVRKPNWEYFPHINKIGIGEPFMIGAPLNYFDKKKNKEQKTLSSINKTEYLQNTIFRYAQSNPKINEKIKEMINKEKISNPRDIPTYVIKEMVRKPNWECFSSIDEIDMNEMFIIRGPSDHMA